MHVARNIVVCVCVLILVSGFFSLGSMHKVVHCLQMFLRFTLKGPRSPYEPSLKVVDLDHLGFGPSLQRGVLIFGLASFRSLQFVVRCVVSPL